MRRAVLATTSQTRRARLTTASVIAASRHCADDPDLDRGAPGIGKRLAALEYTVDSHDHDDAGERVNHPLIEEVAPQGTGQGRADRCVGPGFSCPKCRYHVADEILDHEAADAGAGVHRRQDEQRLEQNGEMIPEASQRRAAE